MMTSPIDETHDPARSSWVQGADGHADFPIQNLPLGVFAPDGAVPRGGVAIGDFVLDLKGLAEWGGLSGAAQQAAAAGSGVVLNALLALGTAPRRALRSAISALLADRDARDRIAPLLHEVGRCTLHLPAAIGDYTDFYVGIHHATNVGRLFRPDNALLPNYKHIPIGYHGRASSVRPSGAAVRRPNGQRAPAGGAGPAFGPSQRLDYELELGMWVGSGNALGAPIAIGDAEAHVAGLSLLNDWSARDLQAWEYQPLGPFLAKNFLTTVSPWIVTAEALAPFRVAQPARPADDPRPLPYLWDEQDQAEGAYGIMLEAAISSARMREQGMAAFRLSRGLATNMYWTVAQMITHHTSNGCDLNPGDLLGTGTISAPSSDGYGSLLEISGGGAQPIALPTGENRTFLEDGDELALTGRLERTGFASIGFGRCVGTVLPAAALA